MKNEDPIGAPVSRDPVCGMNVRQTPDDHSWPYDGRTFYFCCRGCLEKFKDSPQKFLQSTASVPALFQIDSLRVPEKAATAASATFEIDPVCKMNVRGDSAKGKFEHGRKTYYFCGIGCLEKFKSDPDRYLSH